MALINCLECSSKISDQAVSCPQCGMPHKQNKHITNLSSSIENIGTAVVSSQNYFTKSFWLSSKGRISRGQYIFGFIVIFIIFILSIIFINYLSNMMGRDCRGSYDQCMNSIIATNLVLKAPVVFIIIYSLAVLSIKRFHDFCKSGYNVFLLAIPIIGFYYLWVLLSTKGNDYKNMYDNH